MLGARWSRAELVSASSQTPHLAEESEDWCVDNYWSTVVAAAVAVAVVVTVSAVVVLPDAGWRNAAAAAVVARVCSQRAARDWAVAP